jgi:hypothetical protein
LVGKPRLQKEWWRFESRASRLYEAIKPFSEVLAVCLVSEHAMPVRVSSDQVFSHRLGVFATDSYHDQAVLSSSLHNLWSTKFGSTLETRVNYSLGAAFGAFPRPAATVNTVRIGRLLEEERREVLLRRKLSLTEFYNMVSSPDITGDPDVDRLREIHVELDEAVVEAYGWTDVRLDHGFHSYRHMQRFTVSPTARVELLDRLLGENHRRSAGGGGTEIWENVADIEGGSE